MDNAFAEDLTDEAAQIFEQSKHEVFQIKVIDLSTGEKSSTGSGFYISDQGHMATNYHVVSSYVMKPDKYQVEYIGAEGVSGTLNLIYFDVVHDLAVLQSDQTQNPFLSLENSQMDKGARIFSMGNPHDLGMSIIEGIFNGVMDKSSYRKILFSGSLNPGMSGGPALNHKGEVIGINVATMGNDVSFLVPVEFLRVILEKILDEKFEPIEVWDDLIEEQLLDNQNEFVDDLLNSDWPALTIGDATVPGEIGNSVKCWSNTLDKEKNLFIKVTADCQSTDYVFLSDEIYTAYYAHWFMLYKERESNPLRLYNHMEKDLTNSFSFYNEEDDNLTTFNCHTDFVKSNGRTWKTVLCVRQYKKYEQLFDGNLLITTTDDFEEGLMGQMIFMGISQEKVLDLVERFMGEIRWEE